LLVEWGVQPLTGMCGMVQGSLGMEKPRFDNFAVQWLTRQLIFCSFQTAFPNRTFFPHKRDFHIFETWSFLVSRHAGPRVFGRLAPRTSAYSTWLSSTSLPASAFSATGGYHGQPRAPKFVSRPTSGPRAPLAAAVASRHQHSRLVASTTFYRITAQASSAQPTWELQSDSPPTTPPFFQLNPGKPCSQPPHLNGCRKTGGVPGIAWGIVAPIPTGGPAGHESNHAGAIFARLLPRFPSFSKKKDEPPRPGAMPPCFFGRSSRPS